MHSRLLSSNASETECHQFLFHHANLFLIDGQDSYFAISKLKLGSELELDFAIPYEDHSNGLFWELIELKGPGDSPYTRKGTPSSKLTEATQQIRDWKNWIRNSRQEAQRIFSLCNVRTERQPNFCYTIIIGTRENSRKWLDKRNDYSLSTGFNVRSFDYLTSRLEKRAFFKHVYLGNGSWDQEHPYERWALANPFVEAFTDSRWKKLLQEPEACGSHFVSNACDAILKYRTINQSLLERMSKSTSL
jgi:hypothetical protein